MLRASVRELKLVSLSSALSSKHLGLRAFRTSFGSSKTPEPAPMKFSLTSSSFPRVHLLTMKEEMARMRSLELRKGLPQRTSKSFGEIGMLVSSNDGDLKERSKEPRLKQSNGGGLANDSNSCRIQEMLSGEELMESCEISSIVFFLRIIVTKFRLAFWPKPLISPPADESLQKTLEIRGVLANAKASFIDMLIDNL